MSWQKTIETLSEPGELFFHNIETLIYKYSNDNLQAIQFAENNAVAARVIKDNKIGFSMGNAQMEPERLLQAALKNAAYGKKAHFTFPRGLKPQKRESIDSRISNFNQEACIDFVNSLGTRLKRDKPSYRSDVTVGKSTETVVIETTTQNNQSFRANAFSAGFSLEKAGEGDLINVGQVFHHIPTEEHIEESLTEAYQFCDLCENIVTLEGGQYPVLIHPFAFTYLLEPLYSGLSAKLVFDELSPIRDKIGERILSEKFTLYDDPLHQNLTKFGYFDDEGVPFTTKKIIDGGRLTQYLSNLEYSERLGLEPSGNGFRKSWLTGSRQLDITPSISPTNRVLQAGQEDWRNLLADIKEGLLLVLSVDCWIGNIINGDFSGTVDLGFKIKDGQLVGRLKNMRISGNVYQMFGEKLVALSNKPRNSYNGSDLFPYVLCKDVNIS